MVSTRHRKIKNHKEIKSISFLLTKIVMPIGIILLASGFLINIFPSKNLAKILMLFFPKDVMGIVKIIFGQQAFVYWILVIFLVGMLFYSFMRKIVKNEFLLNPKNYYLIPTKMLILGAILNTAHKIDPISIPSWQYIYLLYHQNDFRCRYIALQRHGVNDEDKPSKIETKRYSEKKIISNIISIGISDSFLIDIDKLPNEVSEHDFVDINSFNHKNHQNVREYNSNLVKTVGEVVRNAEINGVTTINLLPYTHPKHLEEIVRESFNDAGRNGLQHLYVYDSPKANNFHFKSRHKIF